MDYNALVIRATFEELLRRQAYADYEELLRREVVDDFINNAVYERAFVAPGTNNRPAIAPRPTQRPVAVPQPSFVFPQPSPFALPSLSRLAVPSNSFSFAAVRPTSTILPPAQPTPAPAPAAPQPPPAAAPQPPPERAVNTSPQQNQGGGLNDALASINAHISSAAASVSAALATTTAATASAAGSDKDIDDGKTAEKHALSPGIIVAIVTCSILFVLLLLTIILYFARRNNDEGEEGNDAESFSNEAAVAPGEMEYSGEHSDMREIPLEGQGGPTTQPAAYGGQPQYHAQQEYSAYDHASSYKPAYGQPAVNQSGYAGTTPPQLPDPFADPHHNASIQSPFAHPADHYTPGVAPHSAVPYSVQGAQMAGPSAGYGHYEQEHEPHSPASSRSSFSSAPSSPSSPDSPHSPEHYHHKKSKKFLKVVNA